MSESKSKNTGFQWLVLATLVALISAVAGSSMWFAMHKGENHSPTAALMVLPEPRVIADFALIDHEGQSFGLDRLRGQWSLIFFGFTHCPDVCPNTLYDLKLISENLRLSNEDSSPGHQVIFVSVDPDRDTPELLSQYVNYFDPGFVGVSGPEEQLAALTMQLGIAYRIEEHEPGSDRYDVFHSASVLLTDPQGRLFGAFPAPHQAEKMAEDLADLID